MSWHAPPAELLAGLVVAAIIWAGVRAWLRAHDAARLTAERDRAAPFIASPQDRARRARARAERAMASVLARAGAIPTAPSRPADPPAIPRPAVPPAFQTPTPTAPAPSPLPRPAVHAAARWIAHGEAVSLAELQLTGGMFYLGTSLTAPDGRREHCLVDPSLPVARHIGGPTGLQYWPAYAELTPSGRRSFLAWLAGGRSDPAADIGLVFLFFYGLERRVFVDRALSDAPVLIAEVERLLGIYGEHASFRNYAGSFLGAARLANGHFAPPRAAPPSGLGHELDPAIRVHLGQLLAQGRPIDAPAALLWVLGSPETRLRTAGQRCFAELETLWAVRFAARNPAGLTIRTPQRRIALRYHLASGAGAVDIPGPYDGLPDIAGVTAPLQGLRDLLESCMTELDPYSRFLGRRPEAQGGLEAAMLLPSSIRATSAAAALLAARARLDALLGAEGLATTTPLALAAALDIPAPADGPGQQFVTRLALMLDHLDVGLEPDRRYGGAPPRLDGVIVAFRAPGGAPIAAGHTAFDAARVGLEIGLLAAAADGEVSAGELAVLFAAARRAPGLAAHERRRLEAFLHGQAAEPPRLQAAVKRAAGLDAEGRAAIAEAALGAVVADGHADADEVRFLERLHRSLHLPAGQVHAALHQRAAARQAPVIVAAEDLPPDLPLPPRAPAAPGGLRLDHARLARIQAETTRVSAMLADVFADDAPPTPLLPPIPRPSANTASPYPGLDAPHAILLAFVVAGGGRTGAVAFETEAQRLRLLPAAALEAINDWGFATHDEPVLEEDGEIVAVPDHLRPALAPN